MRAYKAWVERCAPDFDRPAKELYGEFRAWCDANRGDSSVHWTFVTFAEFASRVYARRRSILAPERGQEARRASIG